MLRRSICLFICVVVAVVQATHSNESDSTAGSAPEVTVYRVRTDSQLEMFQDDAAEMAANIEDIIMAHDHEREFLTSMTQQNFKESLDAQPYYEMSQKDQCLENNGNCSQKCETVGHQAVCSCNKGYTLTSTTDCRPISGCDIVLSGTSGEFTIDKEYCRWTIKAPNQHIIEVRMVYHGYYRDDGGYVKIYDGDSTAASLIMNSYIDEDTRQIPHRSSSQNLIIASQRGWSKSYTNLHVSYVTGSKYLQVVDGKNGGQIEIPVTSSSEAEECFSLTYDKQTPILNQIIPQYRFERADGKWKRAIFRVPFHQRTEPLKILLLGEHARIYNFGRCLNIEYHAVGGRQSLGPSGVCRNGGVWNNTTQSCVCPQGFIGVYCEEGCGPNRYGENCSKLCSYLSNGCEGMIFCTKDLCSCAPGLQGVNCDSPCEQGYYGASCKERCGKCKDGKPCDRYTGKCYSGCATEYYPPFCQQTYKVLLNAPEIVEVTYNSVKIRISFENVTGEGEPNLYQVQYKEEKQEFWSKLSPRIIPNETEFEISGLQSGKVYETRVILIDEDGGRYQTDAPKSKARTKCIEPHQVNFNFAVNDVDESSVQLEWSYEHDNTTMLCEIVEFELSVHCGHQHFKLPLKGIEGYKIIPNLIPDTSYRFQLIGKTVTGKETPPTEVEVDTLPAAPGRVRDLRVVPSKSGRQLNVAWQPPWGSQEELLYKVSYVCLHLLACEDVTCYESSGDIEVSTTSAVLHQLQPHALYQIGVTSVSSGGLVSESYIINTVTADAAPHVAPSNAENPILGVTNTSVLLSWLPPKDCSALNGYIYGYTYALVENDTEEIIQQGSVPENVLSVNFSGLTPSHCYDAHITVVSSGGSSLSNVLVIPFCTSSTAPDRVQSLTVYKKSRRMIGLRWSPPLNTYGVIKYFTITYAAEGSSHNRKVVVEPKPCGAWVDLYCHTVSGLSPGKNYHFQVQARNKEVSIDGEPATVESVTLEGASTPPLNLRMVNATETSMWLEWKMPDKVNGQLRSFIIIVEQIDTQLNSNECCDEIQLLDYRVTSEEPVYQYEVTGLSAASTYSVKVSAKTVTLGDEAQIITHTYPPKPTLAQNALVVVKREESSQNPDTVTLHIQPAEKTIGLNRTYLLLYLTNSSSTEQPFDDMELSTFIQTKFTENYRVISEFTQEEVESQPIVTFQLNDLGIESTETESQKYALILIQDYVGNRNMDLFVTEEIGV